MKTDPTPWEIEMIMMIDRIRLKVYSEKMKEDKK